MMTTDALERLGVESRAGTASPHELIRMLFDGATSRLEAGKRHLIGGNAGEHASAVDSARMIVGGLRESLDLDAGGALAENLDALYDYMIRRLAVAGTAANTGAATQAIDEVVDLLRTLREAWAAIGDAGASAGG